jgi:hypothetical protein
MRIPTYGRIMKIIDFGRSSFTLPDPVGFFISDAFFPGNDAANQYNCEPFLNENKPRLDPNYSFDLSRLGTSIYDFVIGDCEDDDMDEFQRTIHRWCSDDNGKNVLYKKNGDDRYPNFKLYKMISRTVHQHTPENQLNYDYFKQYCVKSKNTIQEDIIDPLLNHIMKRVFPYIILTCVFFILLLIVVLLTLGIIVFQMRRTALPGIE